MKREKKSVRLNIALNVLLHEKLVSEASKSGLNVNDIIRNSIVEHYDRIGCKETPALEAELAGGDNAA